MSKPTVILVSLCAILALASTVTSQPQPSAKKGLFSTLTVGQVVTVNDNGPLFQISTIEKAETGTHKIAELGSDYIVFEDMARVSELRVPLHAIKAIIHVKAKQK